MTSQAIQQVATAAVEAAAAAGSGPAATSSMAELMSAAMRDAATAAIEAGTRAAARLSNAAVGGNAGGVVSSPDGTAAVAHGGGEPAFLYCADLLQVTVPSSFPSDGIVQIATVLSFLPWLFALIPLWWLYRRRKGPTSPLLRLAALTIAVVVLGNEFFVKKWLDLPSVSQRPPTSCLTTKGMPSSHSMLAASVFVVVLRLCTSWRGLVRVVALLLLLMVPPSRVVVGDHTPLQAAAGTAVGAAAGWLATAVHLRWWGPPASVGYAPVSFYGRK